MVEVSETRYAMSGGFHIAYRVVGDAPVDIVLIANWLGHVEAAWEGRELAQFLERLGSFGRLITFDKRGIGLSDPLPMDALPTLEEWMDDVRAVMEAEHVDHAAMVGIGSGGAMAMMFAATHPERVSALVLVNAYARLARDVDYLFGLPPHVRERLLSQRLIDVAGSGALTGEREGDASFLRWWTRFLRLSASPGTEDVMRRWMFAVDVRSVLPAIDVPTMVLHRRENRWVVSEHGRYLAEKIKGARYVELPGGEDLFFLGDTAPLLGEIEEFLTGMRSRPEPDRVLSTVLFSDIVGSTVRASSLGDRRWRELLDSHDAAVRRQLERFQGRAVDFAGDGVLATFDGPARAIRSACAIREEARNLDLDVRCGLHTGEIELRGDDVAGIAVHIGHRVSELARPGEVLVSSTVKDLVAGSGIQFSDRGAKTLKGVPGRWRVYAVDA